MQIRISMACGKFLQSEPSLSLCLSLCVSLSWALSFPCMWRRWDEALDDEMKKECSHCGWFCESQSDAVRELPRVWTSCTELECSLSSLCPEFPCLAAVQSHWIPQGDGLVSAFPYSEEPGQCCATRNCSLSWLRLLLCAGMFYKPVVAPAYHILRDVITSATSREPWLHHTPAQSGARWMGTLLQLKQTWH